MEPIIAIVPAFNEEKKIAEVVTALRSVVSEVVVVDDCSVDQTAHQAAKAGATVLEHIVNRGQGAALETGHAYARNVGAAYVVHFDGDGQFSAADIPGAIAKLKKEQADILFGSRFLDVRSDIPVFKRYILLPVGKYIDRCFGSVHLSDVHNGFRVLNKKALEKIVITQDRMAHASQIPQLVQKYGLRYTEYPVHVTYHEYGQGTAGGFAVLKDMIVGYFV